MTAITTLAADPAETFEAEAEAEGIATRFSRERVTLD